MAWPAVAAESFHSQVVSHDEDDIGWAVFTRCCIGKVNLNWEHSNKQVC